MATDVIPALPEGFVLEEPSAAVPPPPPGFVLEPPSADTAAQPIVDETQQELGFLGRIQEDLSRRNQMAQEAVDLAESGDQSRAEALFQVIGKAGAGAVLDIIGETVSTGAEAVGEGLSAITPDEIEDPLVEALTRGWAGFLESEVGQMGIAAINQGVEAYNEWKSENPRAARNLEAGVDIGLLLAPAGSKARIKPRETFAEKAATGLEGVAARQTFRQKANFVDNLITPPKTKKVREEEVLRATESGVLRGRRVELSPQERLISDTVSTIEGIEPGRSNLFNLNAIQNAARQEADDLMDTIRANDKPVTIRDFDTAMAEVTADLKKFPELVGDAAETAERLMARAEIIFENHPKTASGLLAARREFDQWVLSRKSGIFGSTTENAMTVANRAVRQKMNQLIDERVPGTQESLTRQSHMWSAIDNVAPKAAAEGNNAIMRTWQRVSRLVPASSSIGRDIGLTVGGTALGLGATQLSQGMIAGTAAAIAGAIATRSGIRLIMSPQAKKATAELVRLTDKAIRTATDPDTVSKLRADRAALLEILDSSVVQSALNGEVPDDGRTDVEAIGGAQ